MNMEDIKTEFPEMPEDVRLVIARTVADQLQTETAACRKSAHPTRRIFFMALAAALALAGTAAAAEIVHRFHSEQVGSYGVHIVSEPADVPEVTVQAGEDAPVPETETEAGDGVVVSRMRIVANWLPEGVSRSETEDDHYYDEAGELVFYLYQEYTSPDGDYTEGETGVTYHEDMLLGGHEAVYLERQTLTGETTRVVCLSFPEDHIVVRISTGTDRETLLTFAENITLEPIHGTSFYLQEREAELPEDEPAQDTHEFYSAVSREDMANTHSIGDTFAAEFSYGMGAQAALDVCIRDVQVMDDLALLEPACIEPSLAGLVDENGKLGTNTLQYVRQGDGVNTLDEIVYSEDVAQVLVLVTMEITNTTGGTLEDVSFFPCVTYLEETPEGYSVVRRDGTVAPNGEAYDWINETGRSSLEWPEMIYHDADRRSDQNGSNYIYELAPGETAVLHVGFIVNEDMLPYLYLYASGINSSGVMLSDRNLAEGYVDIRQ